MFGVRDGQLVNLGTAEVGDRVKLRTLWLEKGKAIMDVVEAGPKDPACCPTQLARKTYAMEGGALKQSKSEATRHDHDRYAGRRRVDARRPSTASPFRPD